MITCYFSFFYLSITFYFGSLVVFFFLFNEVWFPYNRFAAGDHNRSLSSLYFHTVTQRLKGYKSDGNLLFVVIGRLYGN